MDELRGLDKALDKMMPKKWSEASVKEKLELIKRELNELRYQASAAYRKATKMESHSHLDGEIVVPLQDRGGGECGQIDLLNQ